MKLKKFKEYLFTENTEALVKDCWYNVYGYKIHFGNENLNYLHLEKNNSCQVIFSVIQELRENPQEPEKPKKIEMLGSKTITLGEIIKHSLIKKNTKHNCLSCGTVTTPIYCGLLNYLQQYDFDETGELDGCIMWSCKQAPEKPEEFYVNAYKDNRIEITCDLEQAKRLESINDMRSRAELHHCFKSVETDYVKYFKYKHFVKNFENGWTAKKTEIGLTIYFGTKRMYQLDKYKSVTYKYYILELLDEIKAYTTTDIIDKMWNKINELIVFINYLNERENNELKKI